MCNLDDMTPEALSYACGRILEAGALDVYTLPGTMKKGRPGHVLTVLCEEGNEEEMVRKIFRETATNGVRARRCEKYLSLIHILVVGAADLSMADKVREAAELLRGLLAQ